MTLEAIVRQAWDEYVVYLKRLEIERPEGASLTAPEFLWRYLLNHGVHVSQD